MIAGVDEAGKGPVLGPMCVAGILLDGTKIDELSRIGVKDSKQLTAKKREVMAGKIKTTIRENRNNSERQIFSLTNWLLLKLQILFS